MKILHPQEEILEEYNYNGLKVELAFWSEAAFCGKLVFAGNLTDEPNVDQALSGFFALDHAGIRRCENDWDVCLSIHYLSAERTNGVMFGYLVNEGNIPKEFDIFKIPAAFFLRILINEETAACLKCKPWKGGIPPYEWVGEQIAPALGFQYGKDTLPIIEYYGFYQPEIQKHRFCYLYVPVQKIEAL